MTRKIELLKRQIEALTIIIDNGASKNPYAIKNKIRSLKKELEKEIRLQTWEDFLAK